MNMKELLNAVRWAKNNPGALMKAMGDGDRANTPDASSEAESGHESDAGQVRQNGNETV